MGQNDYENTKRGYERLKVDVLATLILKDNTRKGFMLRDVSARGLRGVSTFPLEVNEVLSVVLQAPFSQEPIKKEVRVVWCRDKGAKNWELGLDFGWDQKIDLIKMIKSNKT